MLTQVKFICQQKLDSIKEVIQNLNKSSMASYSKNITQQYDHMLDSFIRSLNLRNMTCPTITSYPTYITNPTNLTCDSSTSNECGCIGTFFFFLICNIIIYVCYFFYKKNICKSSTFYIRSF